MYRPKLYLDLKHIGLFLVKFQRYNSNLCVLKGKPVGYFLLMDKLDISSGGRSFSTCES